MHENRYREHKLGFLNTTSARLEQRLALLFLEFKIASSMASLDIYFLQPSPKAAIFSSLLIIIANTSTEDLLVTLGSFTLKNAHDNNRLETPHDCTSLHYFNPTVHSVVFLKNSKDSGAGGDLEWTAGCECLCLE